MTFTDLHAGGCAPECFLNPQRRGRPKNPGTQSPACEAPELLSRNCRARDVAPAFPNYSARPVRYCSSTICRTYAWYSRSISSSGLPK